MYNTLSSAESSPCRARGVAENHRKLLLLLLLFWGEKSVQSPPNIMALNIVNFAGKLSGSVMPVSTPAARNEGRKIGFHFWPRYTPIPLGLIRWPLGFDGFCVCVSERTSSSSRQKQVHCVAATERLVSGRAPVRITLGGNTRTNLPTGTSNTHNTLTPTITQPKQGPENLATDCGPGCRALAKNWSIKRLGRKWENV